MTQVRHDTVHGTCVALGPCAALLRGKSGSGKSDLALRFLALPPSEDGETGLVADDQVRLHIGEDGLIASPPEALAGLMEVRGLGIQSFPFVDGARLVLVCDLVAASDVPRMPPDPWDRTTIAGTALPAIKLAPFEASAPLKLKLAIVAATAHLRAANNRV
ncbi:MAG: HPr kinase/phosphatase C-terminal domain-containing protein [Methyloceanibacter sp.]|nr:HPr kinase/phosphatase C-terminal domain-containing protein [Methyloceanibacter sp.]